MVLLLSNYRKALVFVFANMHVFAFIAMLEAEKEPWVTEGEGRLLVRCHRHKEMDRCQIHQQHGAEDD